MPRARNLFRREVFTRLYLWRHPEVRGGQDGVVYGQSDVALTRNGNTQLKNIARYMSQFKLDAVYCSDLQRSMLVAEAVGRSQDPRRKPVVRSSLRELDLGQWEGMSIKQIQKEHPEELEARWRDIANYRIEGGETLTELFERIIPVFQEIIAENQGRAVCVISHGGVNRVFLAKLLGMPLDRIFRLDQEYGCLNLIDVFEDGIPLLRGMNQQVID
ncbi:MAG: histidine phosphatase family protein [Desulfarculaceae bacterium]|nr:histidine phosphatase family protein [Desulfarculaceae bacterium]MCF8073839.1 histidine phosphatase family protein [Desulfarculaceae bacterium]MCF8102819.1 histidine phosphatase family protein [Desulfarculaceae bacterium]MCF8116263.1 histidine phosphatase family protein [Desulfarculaceae bacterium]